MRVDMLATYPWYRDHIQPVFDALPDGIRGIDRRHPPRRGEAADITLVAGTVDWQQMAPHPCILIEHGVGQTYVDRPRPIIMPRHIIGHISPSERVAAMWDRPAAAVGCPRLDRLLQERRPAEPRTLAVTWRWNDPNGVQCPELRSARGAYLGGLLDLIVAWRAQGWTVLGHGHPRAQHELATFWRNVGIRPTWDSFEVLGRAALVIGDNSSLLYEAAALARAVLVLNAPWYRRDVEHGLRFWSDVPGQQIDTAEQLAAFDIARYSDEDLGAFDRDRAVFHAYAHTDGKATDRAVAFVLSLLGDDPLGRSRGVRPTRPAPTTS